jgi:hypothetical protein
VSYMNIAGNGLEHVERDKEIKRGDIRWRQERRGKAVCIKGVYCFVYVYYTMTKGGSSMQRLSDDLILTLITHPITKPTKKKVTLPYPSFIHSTILCDNQNIPLIFDDPSSSP